MRGNKMFGLRVESKFNQMSKDYVKSEFLLTETEKL